mgnify:CR=1 FL=1
MSSCVGSRSVSASSTAFALYSGRKRLIQSFVERGPVNL